MHEAFYNAWKKEIARINKSLPTGTAPYLYYPVMYFKNQSAKKISIVLTCAV